MSRRHFASLLGCAVALSLPGISAAGVVWNESVNGDLSDDRLNPTSLTLHAGSNLLTATTGGEDREYVHFNLPAGTSMTAIIHVSWAGTGDNLAFIGVQDGTTFTEPPVGTTVSNLLGYAHFGPDEGTVGTDILPLIGMGFASMGFSPPLTGSDYTFWIQQLGNEATYTLDFQLVPQPGAMALVGLAGCVLAIRRRR